VEVEAGFSQKYPLISPVKKKTMMWKGLVPMETWRGAGLQEVYLPDNVSTGAIIFEHTPGVIRSVTGETRRTLKIDHMGHSYVFIQGYSPGQNWTYMPSELDLYNVISIKRFFFSGLPVLSEGSTGFRGKRAVPIQEVAKNYEVRDWDQSGFTLSNIFHALPNYESLSAISQNITCNRDILTWLDGTYVDVRCVKINLPGSVREGYADGRCITEILWAAAISETVEFNVSTFPPEQFFQLCKANGLLTNFVILESGYRFRLRWPRYYKSKQKVTYSSTSEVFDAH